MDKILITGVAGFIGSNLANHLLQNEKNLVYGIDNFSHSTMSNLYPLLKNNRFEFIEHDLMSEIPISADFVFHFAGNGDLSSYYADKFNFVLNKIKVTDKIISYCQKQGCRLILPSSYSNYELQDLNLYCNCINLIEELIIDLNNKNKLNSTIVRLNSVYGQNMLKSDKRFIPSTINDLYSNSEYKIKEDESCYFTYIQDVVINLEKIMNSYIKTNTIDLINQNLYLKSDVAKLIKAYLKSSSKITLDSQIQTHPDFTPKVTDGFKCETPIVDGLIDTIKHYKLINFD